MALKKWVNTNVGSGDETILTVGTGNTAVIFGIKLVCSSSATITLKLGSFNSSYQVTADVPYSIDDKIVIESDGTLICNASSGTCQIYVSGDES